MKIFVDSSALVALYNHNDPSYHKAQEISNNLIKNDAVLYLAYPNVLETATIIRKKVGIVPALHFLKELKNGELILLEENNEIKEKAEEIFIKSKIRDLSLFDCLDFALMEFYELDAAFTFDKHYKQMGLKTL